MSTSLDEQIKQLKGTIAEMEVQREILGDAAVESALVPFRQKLAELEAQVEPSEPISAELPTRQRKLVTLLFMDVVGSTEMSQHLDPEDTMEIMDSALPRLAVPVGSHGGHVTRFMGDGFMAVFGDPIAREDDPEQAIRAGLDILDLSQSLAQELRKEWDIEGFQVRIGINSGLVVLGGLTEAEDTIMGIPVNLAARLESAAPSGGLLISHNTYRHVRGVFDVQPQESINAKGFAEPVPVYLVQAARPRAFRVRTLGVEGIETQMVGREGELKYLQDALLTVIEEGEGEVATITGEAGVGKSRLLYEFQNWIELLPDEVLLFQGRGRQEAQGQPYALLRDLFAVRFQILDDDSGKKARRKIEIGFGDVLGGGNDAMMRVHIIGQLLGFNFSRSPHLKGVLTDPEQLRNRGLMYLGEYFKALSQDSPIVVFLEDIHWGDDTSLDAVNHLGALTLQLRLLIICAARPTLFERRPNWSKESVYHTKLALQPLTERDSLLLIEEILKLVDEIPGEMRDIVTNRAEGNPFYMEEMIKMLIEDGVVVPGEETWRIETEQFSQIEVPPTLVGVLQARLESLPPSERAVLQQASVVGRMFWDRLVAHIHAEDGRGGDSELVPLALVSLRDRELVYRRDESAFAGATEYLFKHDVLREVTYESVLKRLRKTYHGFVADWLIANSGDRINEYSGRIAEHLVLAGREDPASEYFYQAAESALAAYANAEAERFYRRSLELTPPDPLHAGILSGLGEALYRQGNLDEAAYIWRKAIDRYWKLGDSDRLGDVYARLSKLLWYRDQIEAWEVCQEGLKLLKDAPDSHGYARLLAEAGRTAYFRKETDQVLPLCQRALEMAQRLNDLEVHAEASNTIALHQDDISRSVSIFEDVVELAEANGLLRAAARAHHNLSTQLFNSYFDLNSALQHALRAAEISRQIGETNMMMFSLNMVTEIYYELGELKSVEEKLADFLQTSTVPESRLSEFWLEVRSELMIKRGEWKPALETTRKRLETRRKRDHIEAINNINLDLVWIILEMNRFGELKDLSEADNALRENIEIDSQDKVSSLFMAILSVRQGNIPGARDWLTKSLDNHRHNENDVNFNVLVSHFEFELASAEGNWAEAVMACKKSIAIYQNSGHRWEWAQKLIDLGDALMGRNELGDLERAKEIYQQSLEMFTEMGAPGYIEVLEERLGLNH